MPKNIRILCEGISDRDSLRELLSKENLNKKIIKFDSRSRLLKKVNQYIRNYQGIVDVFLIIIDSHCTDPSIIYDKVHQSIERPNRGKVRIHIIEHALESWFLAENNAIKQRFGINFSPISNPQTICKPDEVLQDLLRGAGILKYKKAIHAKAISKEIQTEDLKNKSENYRSFINLLLEAQLDNNWRN